MVYGPQPAKQAAARAYNAFNLVTVTIGTKSVNTINVAIQLQDARGRGLAQVVHAKFYLASTSDGKTLSPTATTSALAIGTNGQLIAIDNTGLAAQVITDAFGRFDINIIQTAGGTNYYLVVCLPDGSIAISPVVAF